MTSDLQAPARTLHGGWVKAYPHQGSIVIEEMGAGARKRIHLDRDAATHLAQQIDLAIIGTQTSLPRTENTND